MKVLFAPDKFKGSLSAGEAAQALANGWLSERPGDEVRCVPLSDGGEGFARVCCPEDRGIEQTVRVSGPTGNTVDAIYIESGEGVFFETASACGLALVPEGMRHPSRTGTRGVGEMLFHLAGRGTGEVFAGLGGSATNDGGCGMAAALGYRFLDGRGCDLPPGVLELRRLERIVPPERTGWPKITAAADVSTPLLGPDGCTACFGRQKGMRAAEVPAFEDALGRLAAVVERDLGKVAAMEPGSGAAGGMGFGLAVFCHAQIVSGFEIVSRMTGLARIVAESDVVVTGEGSLDKQSLSGKVPVALARLAASQGKPILCVAGHIDTSVDWSSRFSAVASASECAGSRTAAIEDAAQWLREASRNLCKSWVETAEIRG